MKSLMRVIGVLIVVAGLGALGHGYMADTTVKTESGDRVHNIGLMEQQRNEMIVGGVVAVIGGFVFLAGEIGGVKS